MLAGNCMRISVRPLDRRPSRHQRAARNTQDHSTATKLAQQPAFSGSPRKSSPNTAPPTALPRKSSPSTPKNADFGPFWVRRANFFALTPTPSRAGRTFSRTRHSRMATLKPTTHQRPKNAPKTPVSHPRRRHRFQPPRGHERASRSTTPSEARVWRSRGRAAAHGHTQRQGPAGSQARRRPKHRRHPKQHRQTESLQPQECLNRRHFADGLD